MTRYIYNNLVYYVCEKKSVGYVWKKCCMLKKVYIICYLFQQVSNIKQIFSDMIWYLVTFALFILLYFKNID